MTNEELRNRLLTDPDFGVSFIIGNNPEAVMENLRGLDFNVNTVEDAFEVINELLSIGNIDAVQRALSVPMLTDQVDPATVVVATGAAEALSPKGRRKSTGAGTDNPWNVGNIFAGLATGYLAIINGRANQQVNQVTTGTTSGGGQTPTKDNTILYVIIALVVVALIALLVFKGLKK